MWLLWCTSYICTYYKGISTDLLFSTEESFFVVSVHRAASGVHTKGGRSIHVVLKNKVHGRMTRRKMTKMALLLTKKLSSVENSRSVLTTM